MKVYIVPSYLTGTTRQNILKATVKGIGHERLKRIPDY